MPDDRAGVEGGEAQCRSQRCYENSWTRFRGRIAVAVGRAEGAPADVGAAFTFLASDRASFTTGTNIDLDGGFTLRPLVLLSREEIERMNLYRTTALWRGRQP